MKKTKNSVEINVNVSVRELMEKLGVSEEDMVSFLGEASNNDKDEIEIIRDLKRANKSISHKYHKIVSKSKMRGVIETCKVDVKGRGLLPISKLKKGDFVRGWGAVNGNVAFSDGYDSGWFEIELVVFRTLQYYMELSNSIKLGVGQPLKVKGVVRSIKAGELKGSDIDQEEDIVFVYENYDYDNSVELDTGTRFATITAKGAYSFVYIDDIGDKFLLLMEDGSSLCKVCGSFRCDNI